MNNFATLHLNDAPRVTAPDGATVHVQLAWRGGSMAQFSLAAGQVSSAVMHRTVEEIWIITHGRG